jgi:hypothetical protein
MENFDHVKMIIANIVPSENFELSLFLYMFTSNKPNVYVTC